jgi:hypothetical protein
MLNGVREQVVQVTPHVVVLQAGYYHQVLKPLFARWVLGWFGDKGMSGLTHDQLLDYVLHAQHSAAATLQQMAHECSDQAMKLLNLSHQWLASVLPHVLAKVNRVSYGLLDDAALQRSHKATLSRRLLCVPFVGKDVPSRASEFSHPDVVIGLSICAYKYEGLRLADWRTLIQENRDMLKHEVGPISERPSSRRWALWVELAGGRVRGKRRKGRGGGGGGGSGGGVHAASVVHAGKQQAELARGVDTRLLPNKFVPDPSVLAEFAPGAADERGGAGRGAVEIDAEILDSIWPLHLVDIKDHEQEQVLYKLLARQPQVIQWYLEEHVLPLTMRFQPLKLSASGQELGGDLVFGCRLGFSGTPSNLLPVELGECMYEDGDDGKIMATLTCPSVVSLDCLPCGWSVDGILQRVARAEPRFHALIDTGALITGLDNYSVARRLLEEGLQEFDACVFLDSADRKMVLLRSGWTTVRLDQVQGLLCGLLCGFKVLKPQVQGLLCGFKVSIRFKVCCVVCCVLQVQKGTCACACFTCVEHATVEGTCACFTCVEHAWQVGFVRVREWMCACVFGHARHGCVCAPHNVKTCKHTSRVRGQVELCLGFADRLSRVCLCAASCQDTCPRTRNKAQNLSQRSLDPRQTPGPT